MRKKFNRGLTAALLALLLLPLLSCGQGKAASFTSWYPIGDENSLVTVTRTSEQINGKTKDCVNLSGELYYDETVPLTEYGYYAYIPFAGTYGPLDAPTLKAVRSMKTLSFSVLGDGNTYNIRVPTFETIEGDHWFYMFTTVKDEIMTFTVNIPDDLYRDGWSTKQVEFFKYNIMFIEFQVVNPGAFNLKFWDIKTHG